MMKRRKIRGDYVTLNSPKTGPPALPDKSKAAMAGTDRQKGESYV